MAVNYLAESSFAVVTSQLQLFGLIVIYIAADISDMACNGLLDRPTTNKKISDKKTGIFHYFPYELKITAIVCAVHEYLYTRQTNTNDMDRQSNAKQERDNLVKREGL